MPTGAFHDQPNVIGGRPATSPRPGQLTLSDEGRGDLPETLHVALTQLQADALITLDRQLADAVKDLVTVAPIEALF